LRCQPPRRAASRRLSLPPDSVLVGGIMAVARSDSLLCRVEDSGVVTSSGVDQQPPAGRTINTIRQHYYPEGGWGWVVVVCAVLVQILCHGIHGAAGVWLQEILGRFPRDLLPAGT
jgi:hypothetical protein